MSLSFWKFIKGILPGNNATDPTDNIEGSLWVNSADKKLRSYLNAAIREVTTNDQSQVLTIKTIDADSNTISNIANDEIKAAAGIVETKLTLDYPTSSLNSAIGTASGKVGHLETLSGVASGSDDLGTFTGSTIPDSSDNKEAFQALETAHESKGTNVTNLITLSGVAANEPDLGTFTGSTIADDSTVKAALQALETELESKGTNVTNLVTLSGVAANEPDLGTFTGSTIADDSTVKAALQALETAHESKGTNVSNLITLSGVAANEPDLGTFTGSTIADDSTIKAALQALETSVETKGNVTTDGAEVLTNKDIDGGTAANTRRITLPKDTKTNLDSLTRKQGTLVYATDDGKLYIDSGAALVDFVGAGAFSYSVSTKTADYEIQSSEANGNYIFTNTGATGSVNFTLPSAVAGKMVTFINAESQLLKIIAASGDKIFNDIFDSLDSIQTVTKRQSIQLVTLDSTNWFATFSEEIWLDGNTRGLFGGGEKNPGPARTNDIDYITIASAGNAANFGDLTELRYALSACGSLLFGVFAGGYSTTYTNRIDYVTISTAGNAIDIADLTVSRSHLASCSNKTHGYFGGGDTGSNSNVVDRLAFTSLSTVTDYGDLTSQRNSLGACSSSTLIVFAGGYTTTQVNTIDYNVPATNNTFTDVGDLFAARNGLAGCSIASYGYFGAGNESNYSTTVDRITFASMGNASDYGDLSAGRRMVSSTSSLLRILWAGGNTAGGVIKSIEYNEPASNNTFSSFGDLTGECYELAGCSNGHGGLA